jgi:hypothetical protein
MRVSEVKVLRNFRLAVAVMDMGQLLNFRHRLRIPEVERLLGLRLAGSDGKTG